MTLAIGTPDGARQTFNFGFANTDARTPITPDTLFQIGSISKVMVALMLHQFAAEGRFKSERPAERPAAEVPCRRGNAISVQHLLDHVAGIPGRRADLPAGGFGRLMPRARTGIIRTPVTKSSANSPSISAESHSPSCCRDKSSQPLGMVTLARRDRRRGPACYAQGYEAADQVAPYVRGVPSRRRHGSM